MKFANQRFGDLGVGGILFPQGEVTDIRNHTLTPDQVRSLSAAVAAGSLVASDAEAAQLLGLSTTPNATFSLPGTNVVGEVTSGSSLSVVDLIGTKDGVNTVFSIPDGTVTNCIPVWNGITLVSPSDFTRASAVLTLVQAPSASDTLWAMVDADGSSSSVTQDLVSSRPAVANDNNKVLTNSTGSNFSLTIDAGMTTDFGLALAQVSTGTCTLVAGAGVTFIGGATATVVEGDVLTLLYVGVNTYIVKRG